MMEMLFLCKQKTAYEVRISDWSSDVCSSDLKDGGADYIGFQITDPWTLRPETVLRISSLNKTQAKPNPDGSYTYVIALQDPGVANWIDTAGLHEGWFQIRWQNVSAGGDPTAEPVRLAKLNELLAALPTGVPMADLAFRTDERRVGEESGRPCE